MRISKFEESLSTRHYIETSSYRERTTGADLDRPCLPSLHLQLVVFRS